jgi:hypothetical protein
VLSIHPREKKSKSRTLPLSVTQPLYTVYVINQTTVFDFLWCYHHQFAVNGPHHFNYTDSAWTVLLVFALSLRNRILCRVLQALQSVSVNDELRGGADEAFQKFSSEK